MNDQLKRFLARRLERAANMKRCDEPGRCKTCGDACGSWSRCKPCRMNRYEDDVRYDPPAGEHWPTPLPAQLPDLIIATDPAVPWE